MRFITQYPGYGVQIRPQRQRALGDGGVEVLTPGLYVNFQTIRDGSFIYENEMNEALRHFNFHGNTQDSGEAVPTDPINRLSVFDTDEAAQAQNWSSEEKALVEQQLVEWANSVPSEILLVASEPIGPPYPRYNDFEGTPVELVVKLIEDGHDLQSALYYEQVFGLKRAEIIEALEQAIEVERRHVITA